MKLKYTLAALAVIVSSLGAGVAHAEISGTSIQGNGNNQDTTEINAHINIGGDQGDRKVHSTSSIYMRATSSKNGNNQNEHRDQKNENRYDNNNDEQNGTSSEMNDEHGSSTADVEENDMPHKYHQTVSRLVHELLQIADREGGIGAEVRVIAHSEDESASTTESAMNKVEEKGGVAVFFFGSDFKNIGVIRSELASTTKNIARLQALLASTTNATDKASLTLQIQALQIEKAKVEAYVQTHEDAFSLFGWLTRYF